MENLTNIERDIIFQSEEIMLNVDEIIKDKNPFSAYGALLNSLASLGARMNKTYGLKLHTQIDCYTQKYKEVKKALK